MTNESNTRKNGMKEKKEKKKRVGGIAAFSLLIALFDRLGEIIYEAIIKGFFGRIFTSYTKLREHLSNGFFGTYVLRNGKIKRFFRRIRKFLSSNLDSCVSISVATKAINKFCSLPLQYYGNFGLFFGIYTVVVYYVKRFVPGIEQADSSHLLVGVIVALSSIPLIFSRISVASSIKNSVFGRAIFKHSFGFSDESFDNKKNTTQGRGNLMLLLGLITGISTLFIHPLAILFAIIAIVILTLIATKPEIGVLITIAVIPFLSFFTAPTFLLSILVLITSFFYIIKVIRGKRTFKLEIVDMTILLFGVLILLSSLFSAGGKDSVNSAVMSFVLMLGYFLLVNLMRTEQWIKRCVVALVSSASIVAIIGVFEFIFAKESNKWLDQGFFGLIKTRVVSLFENPNMLAVFLVMIFPFLVAITMRSNEKNTRFLTKALAIIFVICIIFTWSRAAWIALILGALIFAILYSKKSFRIFGIALFAIPIIPIIAPKSVLERFLSIANLADSSIAYRIYTWKGTLGAISDYCFSGIGYGDKTFQTVYPSYSYSGIEASPHSHSLILQLLLCMGVVGLTVFFIAMFLNFQKCFEFIKSNSNDPSRIYVIASVVSIISALIVGVFDYIWYNQRIFYLFWIIVSIGCAFVRVGNYEKERHTEIQDY